MIAVVGRNCRLCAASRAAASSCHHRRPRKDVPGARYKSPSTSARRQQDWGRTGPTGLLPRLHRQERQHGGSKQVKAYSQEVDSERDVRRRPPNIVTSTREHGWDVFPTLVRRGRCLWVDLREKTGTSYKYMELREFFHIGRTLPPPFQNSAGHAAAVGRLRALSGERSEQIAFSRMAARQR
jgi:hypothetical protein